MSQTMTSITGISRMVRMRSRWGDVIDVYGNTTTFSSIGTVSSKEPAPFGVPFGIHHHLLPHVSEIASPYGKEAAALARCSYISLCSEAVLK